jgi:hypothetical protein
MKTVEMTADAVQAAAAVIPEDTPFHMVNLLRYKERADYGDRTDVAPCSGREAYYLRYLPAFNRVASAEGLAEGITVTWIGTVIARLVAPPDEQWDDMAIVEYPSFAAFQHVIENPRYTSEADPHRRAALEDWRLIATAKVTLSG